MNSGAIPIDDSLVRVAKGELLSDDWSRKTYSVDSSHYEVVPEAILCPVDEYDVQQACLYSTSKKVPIAARGAGTGLLGQSLSDGIILDFTKHMNRVLEIDENHAIVEPGIVKAVLDGELRKKGKFLPPDPASSRYCTVGGMIADNSSGIHCLGYGNTIDFLDGVKVVYADGTFGFASSRQFDSRMKKLRNLLYPQMDLIEEGYPRVSKNSCGYRLDATVKRDGFYPQKIFAASEGTLGLVTSARLKILDIPEKRCLLVTGFEDLLAAVKAVPVFLRYSPVALELMDRTVFSTEREDNTGCLVFVEFAGSGMDPEIRLESCKKGLEGTCAVLEYASDENSLKRIWSARTAALNNIMKLTVGSRKPLGLIEDTVVRPELLAGHVEELLKTYKENGLEYVMYGHVGDGNMHTRPLIDIASDSEMNLMSEIAGNVFAEVIRLRGTITGEHGDGIARQPYIERMYGRQITELFLTIKTLFDPGFTLNPGKKVLSR